MATTTKTAGRPRCKVRIPRKVRFTIQDIIELNDCCALTVRSNVKRLVEIAELVIVGKTETGTRGRPALLFARS